MNKNWMLLTIDVPTNTNEPLRTWVNLDSAQLIADGENCVVINMSPKIVFRVELPEEVAAVRKWVQSRDAAA